MQARLVIPAAALAALALCASPAAAKQVKLTVADTGKTVTVDPGDTVTVALAANQTTPYHWVVTQRPKRGVARITRNAYVQGENPQGMAGVGGTQHYTLKAVGAGTTSFTTQYQEISTHEVGSGKSQFRVRIKVR